MEAVTVREGIAPGFTTNGNISMSLNLLPFDGEDSVPTPRRALDRAPTPPTGGGVNTDTGSCINGTGGGVACEAISAGFDCTIEDVDSDKGGMALLPLPGAISSISIDGATSGDANEKTPVQTGGKTHDRILRPNKYQIIARKFSQSRIEWPSLNGGLRTS